MSDKQSPKVSFNSTAPCCQRNDGKRAEGVLERKQDAKRVETEDDDARRDQQRRYTYPGTGGGAGGGAEASGE